MERGGKQEKVEKQKKVLLSTERLCAGYGDKIVLQDLSIAFESGKITALAGPNGCGKSTLLKALVGLVARRSGNILIGGDPIERLSAAARAKQVAYLPQNKKIPDLTVMTMVLHGRFAHLSYPRRYREQDMEIAREAMRMTGLLGMEDMLLSRLSGGTQQRVFLAMALAQDAPAILMDEPTSFLDISYQIQLMELCRSLAEDGRAIVMVLHDLPAAMKYADRLAVLAEGGIAADGTPEEVYESGVLDRVFGVRLKRVAGEGEMVYYY